MPDIADCLSLWRQAERQRDARSRDSAGWDDVEQAVRHACLEYQASVARATVRYQEAAEPRPFAWWPTPTQVRAGASR